MIPLVLGLGATFIILMGSIDLSVEGVLTLGAVILSMLVLNGANGNDLGLLAVARSCWRSAPRVGFANGVIHVRLKVPSFMATLGTWFIGVGVANALLGGMAMRINDPLDPRPGDRARSSAFPGASGWRSPVLRSPSSSRTTRASGATSTRSAAARNSPPCPASPVARVRIVDLHARRRLLRDRRHPRRGAARPRQRPDRQRAACSPPSPPSSSAAPRCPAARAACCRPSSAC